MSRGWSALVSVLTNVWIDGFCGVFPSVSRSWVTETNALRTTCVYPWKRLILPPGVEGAALTATRFLLTLAKPTSRVLEEL